MTVKILGRRFPATATYAFALGSALLLLIVTVAAAFWQTAHTAELNMTVRRVFEERANYRNLLIALQNTETGQRGYLLTGDNQYLEPVRGARDTVELVLGEIIQASAGDPVREAEAARLQELATRKLNESAHTIGLYQRGRMSEALLIVRSDAGLRLMDEVRNILRAAEAREGEKLIASLEASDRAGNRLRLVILLAGLLIAGIGALLVVMVRRAMADLRASRDDAHAATERLLQEIGSREQAEAQVRQMQKMDAIGQLTGGVAHDFNNMLAVIISALQLARRRLERGEAEVEKFIDAAMDGARRAATLTSRLLAFARRQPLSPALLDLNRILGDMAEMLQRTLGEQIQFELVSGVSLWRVHADAAELENAILNICVNGRDAMPEGGKLTVETANAHLDDSYAATADVTAGQYVMIAITDTGMGMSPDVVQKAFEPFFTTKQAGKGTGLGLSHVLGFFKQSGGHVAIYSEPGHGTTVKLYLPRAHAAADAPLGPSVATRLTGDLPLGNPETLILLVEDEDRVREMSVSALRELGYTVVHASSGARALELLEQHPKIDLLFTDVVMPEMSGRALADEALRRRPDLKVMYTTGYTQNAIVHNGVVDAGALLLQKPYTLQDLARKIRAALS